MKSISYFALVLISLTTIRAFGLSNDSYKDKPVLLHKCERADGQIQFLADHLSPGDQHANGRTVARGSDWKSAESENLFYVKQRSSGTYSYKFSNDVDSDEIIIRYPCGASRGFGNYHKTLLGSPLDPSIPSRVVDYELKNCEQTELKAGDLW